MYLERIATMIAPGAMRFIAIMQGLL